MKIQDLIFVAILILVLWRRNPTLAAKLGIFCLVLAIPLFGFQIFFTAERLTWYAAAIFTYTVILGILKINK